MAEVTLNKVVKAYGGNEVIHGIPGARRRRTDLGWSEGVASTV